MFTLWEIEDKTNFFRIHRSYIINLKYVRELFPLFNYNLKVVMDDNEKTEISVSRNKVKELKRLWDCKHKLKKRVQRTLFFLHIRVFFYITAN